MPNSNSLSAGHFSRFLKTATVATSVAALLSVSFFGLANAGDVHSSKHSKYSAKYPGVFIADTDNRWNLPEYEYETDEQFGYVVCDGGYMGSPLIPNDKKVVDEFLSYCKSGKRKGPGKLPIIDVDANHDSSSTSYLAYNINLNGQKYFLCKGYLNSTERCTLQSDKVVEEQIAILKSKKKQAEIADNLRSHHLDTSIGKRSVSQSYKEESAEPLEKRNYLEAFEGNNSDETESSISLQKNVATTFSERAFDSSENEFNHFDSHFDDFSDEPETSNDYSKHVSTEEVIQEISSTINSDDILKKLNIRGLNLEGAQVIPLTKQSLNSQNLSQNLDPSVLNSLQNLSSSDVIKKKGIKITTQELEALKAGRISLTELVEGCQMVDLEGSLNAQKLQAIPLSSASAISGSSAANVSQKAIQITSEELNALQNGRVSLESLMASKQLVDLNSASGALPNAVSLSPQSLQGSPILNSLTNNSNSAVKAVPITQNTLNALQSGQISLDQVISGSSPINVPANAAANLPLVQAPPAPMQQVPVQQAPMPQQTLAQQVANVQNPQMQAAPHSLAPTNLPPQNFPPQNLPPQNLVQQQPMMPPNNPAVAMQNPIDPQMQYGAFVPGTVDPNALMNPQAVPANLPPMQDPAMLGMNNQLNNSLNNPMMGPMPNQVQQQLVHQQLSPQQFMGMQAPMPAVPAQYGMPAVSPSLQNYAGQFSMADQMHSSYAAPAYSPQSYSPQNYSPLGAPVNFVTTPVYSTHSNMQYFPGAVGL